MKFSANLHNKVKNLFTITLLFHSQQGYIVVTLNLKWYLKLLSLFQIKTKLLSLFQIETKLLFLFQIETKLLSLFQIKTKLLSLFQIETKLLSLYQIEVKVNFSIQLSNNKWQALFLSNFEGKLDSWRQGRWSERVTLAERTLQLFSCPMFSP